MSAAAGTVVRERLNSQQITGFWAAWAGWMLDGMDSFIYALVLAPAMRELLPRSGFASGPADVAFAGSLLFGLFLVGWGLSFIWGPVADRFGRTRTLAGTVLIYSVFTGAAALAGNVYELALFRFLAGIGIGGEWAMAGTYVAEAWPESRRRQGAGYLQTGYYAGFFVAAALNYTVGAAYGWRAMFLCGLAPVIVSIVTLLRVHEPARWEAARNTARHPPLRAILSEPYLRRTIVNTALVAIAIVGLWAGAVYEPTAVIKLATATGMSVPDAQRTASLATGLLSIGTIIGCLALPPIAERLGRSRSAVANSLRLLTLADGVKILLRSGAISAGHARALLALPLERRDDVALRIARDGLTVRAVEALAHPTKPAAPKRPPVRRSARSNDNDELLERLRYRFATHVTLVDREHGGTIELRYADAADLLRIADLLLGESTNR